MNRQSTIAALLFISLCIGAAVAPSSVAAQQDPQPPPTNPGEGEPPRPSDYCYRPTPCVCCVYIHIPGFTIEICVEESWRAGCGGDTGGVAAPAPQSMDPTLLVNGAAIESLTPLGLGPDPTGLAELVALKPNFSTVADRECLAQSQPSPKHTHSYPLAQSLSTAVGSLAGGP